MDGNEQLAWAVVFATFAGPVSAVIVTLWYQGWSARKEAQRSVYAVMMRTRRHPTSLDFVGAFNLVPLHFHRSREVMANYEGVLAVVNDAAWQQQEAQARLNENFTKALAKLLSSMSKAVGLPVDQLTILHGAYAPQGWVNDEQEQRHLRQALVGVLVGARPLPVTILKDQTGAELDPGQGLGDLLWSPPNPNSNKP